MPFLRRYPSHFVNEPTLAFRRFPKVERLDACHATDAQGPLVRLLIYYLWMRWIRCAGNLPNG